MNALKIRCGVDKTLLSLGVQPIDHCRKPLSKSTVVIQCRRKRGNYDSSHTTVSMAEKFDQTKCQGAVTALYGMVGSYRLLSYRKTPVVVGEKVKLRRGSKLTRILYVSQKIVAFMAIHLPFCAYYGRCLVTVGRKVHLP